MIRVPVDEIQMFSFPDGLLDEALTLIEILFNKILKMRLKLRLTTKSVLIFFIFSL